MADCERGLGRPQAALKLVKEALAASPPIATRVELKLVEAGAREALDQRDEAVRLLRSEIELIGARGPKNARARLRYFFAQLLAESGDSAEAEKWFAAAVRLDPDDETGAAEALAELQGVSIDFDDSEEPEPVEAGGADEAGLGAATSATAIPADEGSATEALDGADLELDAFERAVAADGNDPVVAEPDAYVEGPADADPDAEGDLADRAPDADSMREGQ